MGKSEDEIEGPSLETFEKVVETLLPLPPLKDLKRQKNRQKVRDASRSVNELLVGETPSDAPLDEES